ncbi:MAG TPA: NAD+ synthase [Streptosporangiaceae bacterium]|nr:NAD+ synthase [Streptosporangiaceae bacterium]
MPKLRIALAQANSTVGDLAGNAQTIIEWTRRASARRADLVLFPEMMLTGYPVEDLALRDSFVDASIAAVRDTAARLAAEGLGGIAVVTGYLDRVAGLAPRTGQPASAALDAAALLHGGDVVVTTAKHHLPNYGVFDEYRYFVPGNRLPVFRLPCGEPGEAADIAIAICEDLWQDGGPVTVTRQAGAGLLVVPNASPYERGKDAERLELCVNRAAEAGATLAYVNMMGGQDELVFDGDSIIVTTGGELLARGPQFEEALIVVDLDLPAADPGLPPGDAPADPRDGTQMTIRRVVLPPPAPRTAEPAPPSQQRPGPVTEEPGRGPSGGSRGVAPPDQHVWPRLDPLAEVYAALVISVRDYVVKNGFESVILALSGGIDSALTATIAADAIGPQHVHVVLMPSRHSSGHSVSDAEDLVKRQGVHARTVPIQPMVDAFQAELDLTGLAAENLQARGRGVILMGLSNAEGHLALTTGNKSELATGYSTLYGDSAGGFGPIKDVPKTLVWDLARWRNADAASRGQTPPIPENSITKPPSAELSPGQLDSDSLPDYQVLDAILDDYVVKDLGVAGLIAAGHDPALVDRVVTMVDRAEYKRRQYPPGPKITPRNFGRDRRLPITNRWREPGRSQSR